MYKFRLVNQNQLNTAHGQLYAASPAVKLRGHSPFLNLRQVEAANVHI